MRRRDFLIAIAGTAATWPYSALAQKSAMPIIAFLNSGSAGGYAPMVAAFRKGLKEAGYVEGENVSIEFRWADGQYDRLAGLAADLVRRKMVVIAATSTPAAQAAKAITSTIPIVFTTGADPVELGLVANINRPGGNVTGISFLVNELTAKQLEVLHQIVPKASSIGLLINPDIAYAASQVKEAEQAARLLAHELVVVSAKMEREIDSAFATLVQRQAKGLITISDPFLNSRRDQIIALAARHSIPAIYPVRDYTDAGGLMSYGTSIIDTYRLVGVYTGRILSGENPANLPVLRPTKLELVINLRTAKSLRLDLPATLLAVADDAIE